MRSARSESAVRSQESNGADTDAGVYLEAAPAAVRAVVDPWGPVEPGAFALMRGLKDEFDAKRVLNPGRFVGGL